MKSGTKHIKWKALASMRLFYALLSALIMSGCSDHARPLSLEPAIELSEATEISRREATIEARIDRRGSSTLSYVSLIYGASDNSSVMKVSGDPKSDTLLFHLSGLKPGAAYLCHLEAGTETAALKSAPITFTTLPNELPTISSPTPLSTGPLGIIVQFSILDDGGEEVSATGCEVRTPETPESRRIYVSDNPAGHKEWKLSITGLTPHTTYVITPFASNSQGEAHGEPLEFTTKNSTMLQQPGVLANLFEGDTDLEIDNLTISGPMNGDDFRTLRAFLGAPAEYLPSISISEIDLSDATIVEGGASYDGGRFTVIDRLSTGLFADCAHLRSAILPNTAIAIERDVFARCPFLESLTVPALVETLLPSADCKALKAIEVSMANDHFSSIDGVLFNHNASEIIWFPCGKTGDYTLPPSITAIGENAFAGTSITSLAIPPTVTSISRGAFAGSSLLEIYLPDNITNISEGIFQDCSELVTVHLGSGTEYVGNFAFDGTSIRDIYLAAEVPPFTRESTFYNKDSTIFEQCTLHVPTGCRKLYTNHRQWGSFSHIEEFQP